MAAVNYVGATQASARDLVSYGYVQSLLGLNLTQAVVDGLINTTLAPYVTKSYVDTQDALNATKAYVDAGDATRLPISRIGVLNGAVPLLATGRVESSRITVPSTQRYPKPFISPSAYNSAAVAASTAETQVYTCAVADPGYTYKLFVMGLADAATSLDGEYPIIKVHQGSTTGQVVAGGYGLAERYVAGVLTAYTSAGTVTYIVPDWAVSVDCILLGGGGGGGNGTGVGGGPGGGAGAWSTVTLVKGTSLPTSTNQLTITVGAGGAAGGVGAAGNGGDTTLTGTGVTTQTGGGGNGRGRPLNSNGASSGNVTYNGQTYVGGVETTASGQAGNPPGGGGGAGKILTFDTGGAGAVGAAYLFAYPNPNTPSGPVNIVPTPLNAQSALNGATTLYVTVLRSGTSSTQTVSTLQPKLFVVPIPA